MAGIVFVDQHKIDKPGMLVKEDSAIFIKENQMPYVSRGGLKLEKAIKQFGITLEKKICLDIGASTGGFTDCMLKNGAAKVYAIDVGYGQLDYKLRQDERVVCMERTNVRYVEPKNIGEAADFASIDVSFISLKLVLPVVKELIKEAAEIVALIKPQFEAGREKIGKKGVVRDLKVHIEVVRDLLNFSSENGLSIINLSYSPIKGPEGNIEYLIHLKKSCNAESSLESFEALADKVVGESHELL
jgi:23S rRNA (cytidine1920-2'-O)/16S rRNA (cytidine1409-2'-O)-methyltransferase